MKSGRQARRSKVYKGYGKVTGKDMRITAQLEEPDQRELQNVVERAVILWLSIREWMLRERDRNR